MKFVHVKSHLLKFRRQYELLCYLLAKISAFLREIGVHIASIFRTVPYRKWPPLALSLSVSCVIRGYHVYKEVWSPSIGETFECFGQ